jgi:hypothetical protein
MLTILRLNIIPRMNLEVEANLRHIRYDKKIRNTQKVTDKGRARHDSVVDLRNRTKTKEMRG